MEDCKNQRINGKMCKLADFCILHQEIVVNKDDAYYVSEMEDSQCPSELIDEAKQARQSETQKK
jgi:hypothetical protein